jgi:hypothetical protein
VNRRTLAVEIMYEWTITSAAVLAFLCTLPAAVLALQIVRIHGRCRPTWDLLVASPKYLDLSRYPAKAIALSVQLKRWLFVFFVLLALAAVLRVLVSSGILSP